MEKVSKNYRIEELVHPAIIDRFGEARCAFRLKKSAPLLIEGVQRIREFVGESCIVNDYIWNTAYKQGGWNAIKDNSRLIKQLYINSGWRDMATPFRNNLSSHYAMRAVDIKQGKWSSDELQDLILENAHHFPHIVRMEKASATPGWNHFEFGHRFPGQQIEIFKP